MDNNSGRSREEGNPLMQSSTAAGTAVPAATPVDIAERVEEDMDDNKSRSISPKSFNSDEIFDDVDMECGGEEERISDHDLDRLLGPLPLRRASGAIDNNMNSLETESASSDRRKKRSKGLCPCCPQVVQRGPWQCIAAVTGRDGSVPTTRVGNMIVIVSICKFVCIRCAQMFFSQIFFLYPVTKMFSCLWIWYYGSSLVWTSLLCWSIDRCNFLFRS